MKKTLLLQCRNKSTVWEIIREKKTFLSQQCWLKWSSAVNEDPGLSPAGRWTILSSSMVQKSLLLCAEPGQVSDLQIESSGPYI